MAEYLIHEFDDGRLKIKWDNGDLVYLKASEEQLQEAINWDIRFVRFREPDLNNQLTAIATVSFDDDPRFIDFRLV